jgi:hypothetical protein
MAIDRGGILPFAIKQETIMNLDLLNDEQLSTVNGGKGDGTGTGGGKGDGTGPGTGGGDGLGWLRRLLTSTVVAFDSHGSRHRF